MQEKACIFGCLFACWPVVVGAWEMKSVKGDGNGRGKKRGRCKKMPDNICTVRGERMQGKK